MEELDFLPPLPNEDLPLSIVIEDENTVERIRDAQPESTNDGWSALFDTNSKKFYFHNQVTGETTWENPRTRQQSVSSQTENKFEEEKKHDAVSPLADQDIPVFQAKFDRRNGRFVSDPSRSVENYSLGARADRQMSRFFDTTSVKDDGVSLKAERRAMKHSKRSIQVFKQKQKEKQESRRRTWLTQD